MFWLLCYVESTWNMIVYIMSLSRIVVLLRGLLKMVWTVWFQLLILSTVALFIIVMWDRPSYIDLFIFDSLTCLSFIGYCSHGFWSFSIYFLINYYHVRNYRNIGAVFVFENIVLISFLRKKWKQKWFGLLLMVSDRFYPTIHPPCKLLYLFSTVFCCLKKNYSGDPAHLASLLSDSW
jgi:hypothetical protein